MKKLIVAAVCALMLSACGSQKDVVKQAADTAVSIVATEWSLDKVKAREGNEMLNPKGEKTPSLLITIDNRASGFAGCNRYTGSVAIQKSSIKFSKIAATRMFCMNGGDIEDALLNAFDVADNYVIEGKLLTLKKGSVEVAKFSSK